MRQVLYVLLTRSPLSFSSASTRKTSLDLHVLGMPPAFVLSQDQTLMKDFHELDCSLKFADLFIVVLTTFNCWNQMIPYTIFSLSSLFSFQRSISSPL